MPKDLALLLCLGFIAWLFRREAKSPGGDSSVSWVPALWFANITSKPVSYWLGIGGGSSSAEGNPFEAMVYMAIFVAAFRILVKRRVDWVGFFGRNKLLILLLGYFVLSAAWSLLPFPSLKRITKEIGQILVLLVLFTERDPIAALKTTFCRCGFVLLPLSILVIRYYGEMGRAYHHSSGGVMYVGVAAQKNSLGALAFLSGLGLIWEIVDRRRDYLAKSSWWEMRHLILVLGMAIYLLLLSNSKTSLVCFILVLAFYWAGHLEVVQQNRARFLIGFCVIVPSLWIGELLFGISDAVLAALGRDSSLTNRTDIWEAVLSKDTPFLGWGFCAFWDSWPGFRVREETGAGITHNGYLEVFLDGGYLGVAILILFIISALVKTGRDILAADSAGIMKFAFVVMAVVYNWSESAYLRLSPVWFCFLFAALRTSMLQQDNPASFPVEPHEEPEPHEGLRPEYVVR